MSIDFAFAVWCRRRWPPVTSPEPHRPVTFTLPPPPLRPTAPTLELFVKKQVLVPKNDGASVTFMVIPKTLGHVDIKVTARTSVAGDAVQRKLLVKVGGSTSWAAPDTAGRTPGADTYCCPAVLSCPAA